jgi:hypothetical protein
VLLELDSDDLAAGDATVGKEGVPEATARDQRAETIERPCAEGARTVPAAVFPPPQLLFEFRTIPVAIHQGEAVVAVADRDQDRAYPRCQPPSARTSWWLSPG